ncbi:polysaccharide pyruvyl transferase family protein [Gracilibacillus lacisalsi]|uniref:polysaccharide pyruvyl transferase family protein n=1 Tax=Gracilibacillus lacisalsi TaxID=393087 RepID=UPI0003773200|nr:polysaccharide pyruvyl transferase family protein [Gracilibacillus lacisalsi]
MKKIGILTYHYSNNFGGVLQSYALQKYLEDKGYQVEVINFIPSNYKNHKILRSIGLKKNIIDQILNIQTLIKRIYIKVKYNKKIIKKFDAFRSQSMKLSEKVDESSLLKIVNNYEIIIVGSDQVWRPGQRDKKEYFLNFDNFNGKKVSYAADSTISDVKSTHKSKLEQELNDFTAISVRNEHSSNFVKSLLNFSPPIVVDPTLLLNFNQFEKNNFIPEGQKYILVYALGKEINGSNKYVINKIKEVYGNIPVYSIVIPTMKFNIADYSDKVFYDLGPEEWISLFKNATFIYTDSYHGTLFSLKFKKCFIAYYAEKMRSTRFKDLATRYNIEDFIISSSDDLNTKNCLMKTPDYNEIHNIIKKQKLLSEQYLNNVLK